MTSRFRYANRLNSYKARPDLYSWKNGPHDPCDLIARASQTPGLNAIVLNYPEHLEHCQATDALLALRSTSLAIAGINLRYPDSKFLDGAFTNPDPNLRRAAIQLTQQAADVCRQVGAQHLVIWLSNDGFDYPFQMDYRKAWDWTIDALRIVASYAPDLKISIEYKPADPRRFSLLADIGLTLLAIQETGASNMGVTLDFCHQLMAKENPAFSAALCLRQDRLFGLHLNDGYGSLDDGLMVGTVHYAQTLELLYHVVRSDYNEVIYFDTFPSREDPVAECAANIRMVETMVETIERMDKDLFGRLQEEQDGLEVSLRLWEATTCQ